MDQAARGLVTDTRRTPGNVLRPVSIGSVRPSAGFWRSRLDQVRTVTLPTQHAQLETTGRLDNFRAAAGRSDLSFRGRVFNDSDVYKWLEAASFALAGTDDPALQTLVRGVVEMVAAAQQPDGYLHTYFAGSRRTERYGDLTNNHELYSAGHLLQAGIAHQRATGQRSLLVVARRLADHIAATFGAAARHAADGHEEIELALVEMFRATGGIWTGRGFLSTSAGSRRRW